MGKKNRGKELMVFDWDRAAMLTAKIPSTLELNRAEARVMQTGLF